MLKQRDDDPYRHGRSTQHIVRGLETPSSPRFIYLFISTRELYPHSYTPTSIDVWIDWIVAARHYPKHLLVALRYLNLDFMSDFYSLYCLFECFSSFCFFKIRTSSSSLLTCLEVLHIYRSLTVRPKEWEFLTIKG
jgi:hypothetical protein